MRIKLFSLLLALCLVVHRAPAASILFIGNSFTFAQGSPVRYYRADTVTDLNGEGIGGVPALFKMFASEAGLNFDVYLETQPGVGLDWHLEHKRAVIEGQGWDLAVLQGYSTLDLKKPGDATALIHSVQQMAAILRARNPAIDLRLMATWSRADQTFEPTGAWYGKPIETMAHDVRLGYDLAAKATAGVRSVVPVGEAWTRAIQTGVADGNPYDGIDAGKVDLWTYDNYHASTYGYYLEALVLFGSITARDPRSLGESECSGYELGLSPAQVVSLQQVAFAELSAQGASFRVLKLANPHPAARCPQQPRVIQ